MLKKVVLLIIYLIAYQQLVIAQSISGFVFDAKKETIVGASVYFDGTSIGTVTDKNGQFSLKIGQRINSSLVISCLGYETCIIINPFENVIKHIYLVPKQFQLQEIFIKNDLFTRKQKMKIFKDHFLGNDKAGRSCRIVNEEDIKLSYDYDKNTLIASTTKPILVTNSYLGYQIVLQLVEFDVQFNKKSIKSDDVRSSLFLVTSFFTDIEGKSKNIDRRRNRSYYGSQMHFFKTIANNSWDKDRFRLFNGSFQVSPQEFFEVKDTIDMKKIVIKRNINSLIISGPMGEKLPFLSTLNILYKKLRQSKVVFRTNTIFVDQYGNNTSPDLIQFGGDIGRRRVGDLLPLDFELININTTRHESN